MVAQLITSLQHPVVKKLVKLREDRSFRQEQGTLLIVGSAVVQEVAQRRPIRTLISTKPLPLKASNFYLGTEPIVQKIIGHKTEDLVAAEVEIPFHGDLHKCVKIVVLDEVADPGNVGTIFRTALAMGWDGIFVIHGSADPYNDKALRASRGASLFLPWREASWAEVKNIIETKKPQIVVADTQGTALPAMKFSAPILLVLGHETRGPSKTALGIGQSITIPMKHDVESLNVSAAAAILLYNIHEAIL